MSRMERKLIVPSCCNDMINIINQFTEKEFPEFKVTLCEQKDVEVGEQPDFLNVQPWDEMDPTHMIDLGYTSTSNEYTPILLRKEQFKAFTQGCVSICQWLDEKEK